MPNILQLSYSSALRSEPLPSKSPEMYYWQSIENCRKALPPPLPYQLLPTDRHIKKRCTSFIFDSFCMTGPKNIHSSSGCAVINSTLWGAFSSSSIFCLREARKHVQTYPTTRADAVMSIAELRSTTSKKFWWNILYNIVFLRLYRYRIDSVLLNT